VVEIAQMHWEQRLFGDGSDGSGAAMAKLGFMRNGFLVE
jgi:hypothetical protein